MKLTPVCILGVASHILSALKKRGGWCYKCDFDLLHPDPSEHLFYFGEISSLIRPKAAEVYMFETMCVLWKGENPLSF